jgi:hypothetical protein
VRPILRASAAADVEDGWRWYEARREGLGDEFLDAIPAALQFIQDQPHAAPVVHRDVRRQLLQRFPYAPYYRLIGHQAVWLGGRDDLGRLDPSWRTRPFPWG